MKNIAWYQRDCFEFHKKVILQKRNGDFKNNLVLALTEINQHTRHYNEHFNSNTLNLVNRGNSSIPNYCDLYDYSAKSFIELKNELTTDSSNRIVLCQNCTLNNVNSFDHIAPKSVYGAYSIHPLNLFPSCTECNSYKSSNYLAEGECRYLNLYQDNLPHEQFLFVQIELGEHIKSAEVMYYLRNPGVIAPSLFSKIERHYTDLRLFSRFRDNSYTELSIMRELFNNYIQDFTIDEIRRIVARQIETEKNIYGLNYWKSVFKSELIQCPEFLIEFE